MTSKLLKILLIAVVMTSLASGSKRKRTGGTVRKSARPKADDNDNAGEGGATIPERPTPRGATPKAGNSPPKTGNTPSPKAKTSPVRTGKRASTTRAGIRRGTTNRRKTKTENTTPTEEQAPLAPPPPRPQLELAAMYQARGGPVTPTTGPNPPATPTQRQNTMTRSPTITRSPSIGTGASKRIGIELERMRKDPPKDIEFEMDDADLFHWTAKMNGPPDSPYAGHAYAFDIKIPTNYPYSPPQIRFVTPIYHPNINQDGGICLDTLQGQYSPSWTIETHMRGIREMLKEPKTDHCLRVDIGKQFEEDRAKFEQIAKEQAEQHGLPKLANSSD